MNKEHTELFSMLQTIRETRAFVKQYFELLVANNDEEFTDNEKHDVLACINTGYQRICDACEIAIKKELDKDSQRCISFIDLLHMNGFETRYINRLQKPESEQNSNKEITFTEVYACYMAFRKQTELIRISANAMKAWVLSKESR